MVHAERRLVSPSNPDEESKVGGEETDRFGRWSRKVRTKERGRLENLLRRIDIGYIYNL